MVSAGDDDGSAEQAAREATAWFVRLRNPAATEQERQAFQAWLTAGPENRVAYREAETLWRDLDGPAAAVAERRRGNPAPRRTSGWRAAAMIAIVVASGAAALWRDPGLIARARADHATRPGERLETSLRDGTKLFLDADSAVSEDLESATREVTVLRGRVWFDVAKDPARPFVVHADDLAVRVLGTTFGVDREDGVVTVDRGVVGVARRGDSFHLPAGQQVKSEGGRLAPPQKVDPAAALAWRRGLIVLDAAPLSKVFRELDRMSGGRVIAPQAELAAMKLSGVFKADEPQSVLEALRALGLRTVSAPGFATLIYR